MKVTTQVRGIPELMSILSVNEQRRVFVNATNELGALVFKEAKAFVRQRYAIRGGLTQFGFKRYRARPNQIDNKITAPKGRQSVEQHFKFKVLKGTRTVSSKYGERKVRGAVQYQIRKDRGPFTHRRAPRTTLPPFYMIANDDAQDLYKRIVRRNSKRILNKRLRELIRKKAARVGGGGGVR